jgi:hypothetical protein
VNVVGSDDLAISANHPRRFSGLRLSIGHLAHTGNQCYMVVNEESRASVTMAGDETDGALM